jgi:sigma-54 dependent transcriptional regulator, flagellar regulatory protein
MFDGLIGSSSQTLELKSLIAQIADTDAPILIRGSSGVGKEIVARCIHQSSDRAAAGEFVAVNCAAIPHDLLESELFGHVRGAFSGAISDYKGRFRQAHGGTLFLDEIGDMPEQLQVKILRVIQDGRVRPLGADKEIQTDSRIISATHLDMEEAIKAGSFREDLFFRLNVVPLFVADLRERQEEIADLFEFFANKYASSHPPISLCPYSSALIMTYDWPGNVRELENFCQRLSIFYPGQKIDVRSISQQFIPPGMRSIISEVAAIGSGSALPDLESIGLNAADYDSAAAQSETDSLHALQDFDRWIGIGLEDLDVSEGLKQSMTELEKRLISSALKLVNYNVSECSRLLKVNRTTLIDKINRYEIL